MLLSIAVIFEELAPLAETFIEFADTCPEVPNAIRMITNIVLLLNSNIFFSRVFSFSYDFFTKLIKINDGFFQYFELKDINYNFFIN